MIKQSNKFIKYKPPIYTQLINVWEDETLKIERVKALMLTSESFKLEKLKFNPIYKNEYNAISQQKDKELEKIDNSLLWSRRYQKKNFKEFVYGFSMYTFVLIPYIFYKILRKRILEQHVKNEYSAENLKSFNYWNLDFENRDLYPESVIQLYFDIKKIKSLKEEEEEKIKNYSEDFVKNITNGYINDLVSRRQFLGFDDEEE